MRVLAALRQQCVGEEHRGRVVLGLVVVAGGGRRRLCCAVLGLVLCAVLCAVLSKVIAKIWTAESGAVHRKRGITFRSRREISRGGGTTLRALPRGVAGALAKLRHE